MLLEKNKVFVCCAGNNSVYGIVCQINENNTITVGTPTQIAKDDIYYLQLDTIIEGSSTQVTIFYIQGDYNCVYGIACTITGSTIKIGKSKEIITKSTKASLYHSIMKLTNRKYFYYTFKGF